MKRMIWVCLFVFGFILNWSMVFAADVYVESSGSCGGNTPCYSTIQAAINAANSGDTIKLAQGIYAETFVLDSGKQLITQGGWDAEFKEQTPRTTSIRAPVVPKGAIAFQELRIMEIAVPMGNASIADVLDGKTFSSDTGTGLTGNMVNHGGLDYTPSTTDQTIAAGYYNGSGKVAGDADLVSGNIRNGVSIFGVAGSAVVATGDAVVGDVLVSKTFSKAGLANLTGTMSNNGAGSTIIPGIADLPLAAGYWSSANTVSGDTDLTAGNIKSGVTIFSVVGNYSAGGAGVAKTGQTICYEAGGAITTCLDSGTWPGQDAYWADQGVGVTWPNLRFTLNTGGEAGTVTDNLTGLMWAQNANIFGTKTWAVALTDCSGLDLGGHTDWRLPNVKELHSLIDFAFCNPALSDDAGNDKWGTGSGISSFTGVRSSHYWSSTTFAGSTDLAWYVYLGDGSVNGGSKTITYYVWPVRAGQ